MLILCCLAAGALTVLHLLALLVRGKGTLYRGGERV